MKARKREPSTSGDALTTKSQMQSPLCAKSTAPVAQDGGDYLCVQGVAPTYSACSQGGSSARARWIVALSTSAGAPTTKFKVHIPACTKSTAPLAPERSHSKNCSGEPQSTKYEKRAVAERHGVMAGAAKYKRQCANDKVQGAELSLRQIYRTFGARAQPLDIML